MADARLECRFLRMPPFLLLTSLSLIKVEVEVFLQLWLLCPADALPLLPFLGQDLLLAARLRQSIRLLLCEGSEALMRRTLFQKACLQLHNFFFARQTVSLV